MAEQLLEAGILLGVGMSVVFAFLTLLIGGIQSIAWLSNLLPPAQQSNSYNKPKYNKNNSPSTTVDPKVVSAITAAVNTHRRSGQ